MRYRIGRRIFVIGLAAAAAVGSAWASNLALLFKFEISAAYAWERPQLNSPYVHSYAPPFSPGSYQSSAGQTLAFKGHRAPGYSAGLRFFPMPNLGVEVLYDAFKADLSGGNSNYNTHLNYIIRVPPYDVPIERTYEHQEAWPATDGEFKETIFSVNAVGRLPVGSHMSVKVSGGPSFCFFNAKSTSIAFTKFWLAGYQVLFKQEYKLGLDWGSIKTTGFNIGGAFDLDIFANMALALDVRYFSFAKAKADWKIMTGEGISETPAELGRLMNLRPIKFNPSLFRIGLGIRCLF